MWRKKVSSNVIGYVICFFYSIYMFPFDVNKYSVCAGSCLGHYPKVRLLKHSSFSHWIKALDFLLQSGQGKGGECFMNIIKVTS